MPTARRPLPRDPYRFALYDHDEWLGLVSTEITRSSDGGASLGVSQERVRFEGGQRVADLPDASGLEQARRRNHEEVARARHLLDRVERAEFAESSPLRDDLKFYADVLGHYWRWHHSHGFPFPTGYVRAEAETVGMTHARTIYDAVMESQGVLPETAEAFYRLALPVDRQDDPDTKAIQRALKRDGFYVVTEGQSAAQQVREAFGRIETFVLTLTPPPKPR